MFDYNIFFIIKNIMDKYKFIFCGIFTLNDALYFHKKLENNISEQSHVIIGKLLLTKKYNPSAHDYTTFINILNKVNDCKYREESEELCGFLYNKIDKCQLSTLNRLCSNKPRRPKYICAAQNKKFCPHCNISVLCHPLTRYVICGYSNNGCDWEGCGNDWCFICEKKLCKNWFKNNLFVFENRIHNNNCCKLYANKMNMDYNDFCHCNISNI